MKQAKKSRLLAILLSAAMLLSMLPTVAFAEETESTPAEQCTVTEGCTLEVGHGGACAIAESETESTAEPETEPIAEPTEKPPADPTEMLTTEPADGDEDSSYETDEMTEPVSAEGVLLAAELAPSGSCGATESDNVSWALTVNNSNNEDPTYTLTISGKGRMADFSGDNRPTWYNKKDNITEIEVKFGVTSIGNAAFSGCNNVSKVSLPEGLLSIGQYAFECSADSTPQLKTLQFPSTLIEIEKFAFLRSNLSSVVLPAGITYIADGVFKYNDNLTSIAANGVMSIGKQAFEGCTKLSTMQFSNVIKLGVSSFAGCSAINSLPIADGITEIPNNAFANCSGLSSIVIPNSVKTIGNKAFSGCTSLESVTLPGTIEKLGSSNNAAFSNPATFILTGSGAVEAYSTDSWSTGIWTVNKLAIQKLIVSEGIISIGANAFRGLTALTYIELPSTLKSIGDYAFYNYNNSTLSVIDMRKVTNVVYGENGVVQQETSEFIIYASSAQVAESIKNKCTSNTKNKLILAVPNGGSFVADTVFQSGQLATPTRSGYIFGGWFDNGQCIGTTVTSPSVNNTYYAKWTEKTDQSISYTENSVNKHVCANAFTNTLTQATVNGAISYTSSAPNVATVDENGQVTIVGAGTATITATAAETENYKSAKASYTLIVTDHSYIDVVTAPNCTEQGYTTHTCSECTDTYKDTYMNATGHTWSEWEAVNSPNCTDKGSQKRICTVCNVTETEDIDPNGHDWNEKYTVDKQPTTTEDGSKSIHCKSCNVVKDSTVIPAIGQQPAEVNPEGALSNRTLVVSEATNTDEQSLKDAVKNQYKDKFSGKELWVLDINLIDTSVWEEVHDETVTFTVGYPAGITDVNYQNYDFVILHQKADGSMELSNFVATAHGLKITSTLSPFAIGYSERHTHSYGNWKSDANGHWHECDCGRKADEGAHTFTWVIDKEATATQKGSKHEECRVCHYKKDTVDIPVLSGNTGNSGKPNNGILQTGDNSNVTLWISVMVVSLICLVAVLLVMKKKNYRRKWEK